MATIGWTASAAVVVVVLLGVCIALVMSMWDRTSVPPHKVVRLVNCPRYQRAVRVEFMERVRTGFAERKVLDCPLRRGDERCGEGCVWEPLLGARR